MSFEPLRYHCPQCGYDLRGQTLDRCPECGFHYDLPALRHMTWQSFYRQLLPCIRAGQVLAAVGTMVICFPFVAFWSLPLAYFAAKYTESLMVGPFRKKCTGHVLDALVTRAKRIVCVLAVGDLVLPLLGYGLLAH